MADAIFRGYDQQGLDAQYNNRTRFPDFEQHFDRWSAWSEETRRKLPCRLDVPFGPTPLEKLDLFPADGKGAPKGSPTGSPIYVFIHGGYWYSLDKSHYSYVAEGMRPHGIATAVNNFALAPAADMDTIVEHNRRALAWLWSNAASFGGDRDRIYVCGHSAGGHLGLMLLATDWPSYGPGLPAGLVKGVCAIGGIFEMEPIRLSYLNKTLKMDAAQSRRNCPLHQAYRHAAPLSLVVAVDESPEFHRQSEAMQARWRELGYPCELLVPEGLDHFNVVNELADPQCALVRHQLGQMKLAFR